MAETKPPITTTVPQNEWTIYELTYKKGGMLHRLLFKVQILPENDSLQWARDKASEYCKKRTLRYVAVVEHLKDIDHLINFETDENWKG